MLKKIIIISLISIFAITASTAIPEEIKTEGEPVLGDEDAEVTIVTYEDFECPFCKRFEQNAFQEIKSNYVEQGEAKIIWKDRPLSQLHPWAEPAAAAMECVYREGGNEAFWNVKENVFVNQDSIETSNVESKIKTWAEEESVSESAINRCMENDNPMQEVNADSASAEEIGVSGTPTIYVENQKIVGAQPYSNFESAIEKQLGNVRQNDSKDSSTDPEDLKERLNDSKSSGEDVNVSALQERVEEQQDQIQQLKEDQSTILNILDKIMNVLGF